MRAEIQRVARPVAIATALLCASCGEDSEEVPTARSPETSSGLTWYRDIEPIVQVNCNGCHAPGGIAGQVLGPDPMIAAPRPRRATRLDSV